MNKQYISKQRIIKSKILNLKNRQRYHRERWLFFDMQISFLEAKVERITNERKRCLTK